MLGGMCARLDMSGRVFPSTLIEKRRRVEPRSVRRLIGDVVGEPEHDRVMLGGNLGV